MTLTATANALAEHAIPKPLATNATPPQLEGLQQSNSEPGHMSRIFAILAWLKPTPSPFLVDPHVLDKLGLAREDRSLHVRGSQKAEGEVPLFADTAVSDRERLLEERACDADQFNSQMRAANAKSSPSSTNGSVVVSLAEDGFAKPSLEQCPSNASNAFPRAATVERNDLFTNVDARVSPAKGGIAESSLEDHPMDVNQANSPAYGMEGLQSPRPTRKCLSSIDVGFAKSLPEQTSSGTDRAGTHESETNTAIRSLHNVEASPTKDEGPVCLGLLPTPLGSIDTSTASNHVEATHGSAHESTSPPNVDDVALQPTCHVKSPAVHHICAAIPDNGARETVIAAANATLEKKSKDAEDNPSSNVDDSRNFQSKVGARESTGPNIPSASKQKRKAVDDNSSLGERLSHPDGVLEHRAVEATRSSVLLSKRQKRRCRASNFYSSHSGSSTSPSPDLEAADIAHSEVSVDACPRSKKRKTTSGPPAGEGRELSFFTDATAEDQLPQMSDSQCTQRPMRKSVPEAELIASVSKQTGKSCCPIHFDESFSKPSQQSKPKPGNRPQAMSRAPRLITRYLTPVPIALVLNPLAKTTVMNVRAIRILQRTIALISSWIRPQGTRTHFLYFLSHVCAAERRDILSEIANCHQYPLPYTIQQAGYVAS